MQIVKTNHLDNMDNLDNLDHLDYFDHHIHLNHLEHLEHLDNIFWADCANSLPMKAKPCFFAFCCVKWVFV